MSLDNMTQIRNALQSKLLTPIQVESFSNKSKLKFEEGSISPRKPVGDVMPRKEIPPSNLIKEDITFAQCVLVLHYCRLVYKCVSMLIKENCHMECNVHLSNWLLNILKEMEVKQDRVRFEGERASMREKKLKDVIGEYQSKYEKELQKYISAHPVLDPAIIKSKIQEQIRILCLLVETQHGKNEELIRLAHSLDFLRAATSLLIECVDKRNFSLLSSMKIEDFLGNRLGRDAINMEVIKGNSFQ